MKKTITNPILPLEWELYIPDGEPHVFDGTLYLYGSRDTANGVIDGKTHWCSQDYHVICTDDLVNWKDCGVSYTIDEIPEQYLDDGIIRLWAPDVCFNPKDKKYYLFSCLNGGRGFFVASSDSPKGPFKETKRLTIDGNDTFPKCIDPGVLLDDDGKAYITWPGGEGHPWAIAQLDPDDFSNILGDTITPVDNLIHPFEGPSLRKRGDTYYYIYIQNVGPRTDENITPLRMSYLTSSSPLGPYEHKGLIIDTSDYPDAINVHGSMVEWEGKWYLFYHLPLQGYINTRFACAAPLEFNPDGTIQEVKASSCGPRPAFALGEEIPAYSAVMFSGGRKEQRCDYSDPSDSFLFFDRVGQFAGFRYIDFEEKFTGEVALRAKCESAVSLELRADDSDGLLLASFDLKPSEVYTECTVPCLAEISQKHTIYLILKENKDEARLAVSSIKFMT